jgi:hypothetical protein
MEIQQSESFKVEGRYSEKFCFTLSAYENVKHFEI